MKNRISANIIITLSLYLLIQYVITGLILWKIQQFSSSYWFFFIVAAIYHGLIILALISMKDQFKVTSTGKVLTHVNFANLLTLFRLSALPTIVFLMVLSRKYDVSSILFIYMCIAFLTDLFDGAISRFNNQITEIGKKMDSTSDYFIINVISIGFLIYGMIPVWLFLLVLFRGLFMVVGLLLLFMKTRKVIPETSFWGKASVFGIMLVFALEILQLLHVPFLGNDTVVTVFEYLLTALIAVSFVDKFNYFKNKLSELSQSK